MSEIIRPMREADVPACAAVVAETPLWRDTYGLDAGRAGRLFAAALRDGDGLLVAEHDGAVAGFAWFLAHGAFGRSGYLRLIGVAPGRRGDGVGARLLERVEDAVGGDLFLLATESNDGARRFYERRGYMQVGCLPDYVRPGVCELVYWRRRARS